MVSLRFWSLNTLQMCFLIPSISLGDFLNCARPSPLLRPMSLPHTGVIFDNRKEPTSSQVSAPSKLLIVAQPSTIKLPNHPPSVLRKIPETINRRLSHISSDKQSFEAACPLYQEALSKSGYEFKLHYNPEPTKPKRTWSRNVIWFNPPYSATVATNIGHKFLKAIDGCFPSSHPLHKILNRNTLKLSYSCMPNMHNLISAHNKLILAKHQQHQMQRMQLPTERFLPPIW